MPMEEDLAQKAASLVEMLVEKVPLWEMHCNKEPDAAKVSGKARGDLVCF